jgi:4-amino-4-deoxy-L-arabinose transferase-like glycosyltransferase
MPLQALRTGDLGVCAVEVNVAPPARSPAVSAEKLVSYGFVLLAVVLLAYGAYLFSLTLCPPISTSTGLECPLNAPKRLAEAQLSVVSAGVSLLAILLTYPMSRFGGASFLRRRIYQPTSLEDAVAHVRLDRLFLPILALSYVAVELLALLVIPAGQYPYSDPQAFYIPAATNILDGVRCPVSAVNSVCNYEHPPLEKLFLALSMKIFGNNAAGYSIFPVIMGLGSLLAFYGIARKIAGKKIAGYASFFLLIDGVFIGMNYQPWLDTPMVFFGLMATYVYLADTKPLRRGILVGTFLALSILSKETGILYVLAIGAYDLLVRRAMSKKEALLTLATVAVVGAVGLQLYDSFFTGFPTFLSHVQFMLNHNTMIGLPGWAQESWLPFLGGAVVPSSWLIFYPPFGFIATMPEDWLLLASIPVAAYLMLWRTSDLSGREKNLISFVFVWLATTYAPFFFFQLVRATYPFYMFQLLPAVVMADAWMMMKLPKPLKVAFVAICLAWLAVFFPMTPSAVPVLAVASGWFGCLTGVCLGPP